GHLKEPVDGVALLFERAPCVRLRRQPHNGKHDCCERIEAAAECRSSHDDGYADHERPCRPWNSPAKWKVANEHPDRTAGRGADSMAPDGRDQNPAVETDTHG